MSETTGVPPPSLGSLVTVAFQPVPPSVGVLVTHCQLPIRRSRDKLLRSVGRKHLFSSSVGDAVGSFIVQVVVRLFQHFFSVEEHQHGTSRQINTFKYYLDAFACTWHKSDAGYLISRGISRFAPCVVKYYRIGNITQLLSAISRRHIHGRLCQCKHW